MLVTIGVHSPKFEHEADPAAVAAAVERYERAPPGARRPRPHDLAAVRRAGLADARRGRPRGLRRRAAVRRGPRPRARPRWSTSWSREHEAKGTLHRGDGPYVAPPPPATALRFPGKVVALPDGTLLVADSGHHSWSSWPPTARRCCGGSAPARAGWSTGRPARLPFSEPQGVLLLPAELRADVGLRRGRRRHRQPRAARRPSRRRRGDDARRHRPAVDAGRAGTDATCPRPWDVAWYDGRVVVAMAGIHQLWSFDPAHRRGRACSPARPTRACCDGRPPTPGSPSPPAWRADGDRLWLADAETSSLRQLRRTASVAHRRRRGPVRLRPRRRAGRPGAAAAPARRDRAAGRLGRGQRHLQRRGPPLRPGDRPGQHAAHRPGRAQRRRGARRRPAGGRVGGPPAHPGAPAGPGAGGRRRRAAHPPAGDRGGAGRGRPRGRVHAAARPEARRALRPGHPAGGLGHPAGAAARGRGPRRGADPARWCSTAHVGDGVLHVAAMAASCDDATADGGVPRLPRAPAGLGRPGPARRGRAGASCALYLAG